MASGFESGSAILALLLLAGARIDQAQAALRIRGADLAPQVSGSLGMAKIGVPGDLAVLSIILTGAALIREREHGTVEHLLVMPVTPFEIMAAKVWSMALVVLVVLVATWFSLTLIVQGAMHVPIEGSVALFLLGAAAHLFAAPTTHFVKLAQGILYRGADISVVWPQLAAILAIGAAFYAIALAQFRRAINTMA